MQATPYIKELQDIGLNEKEAVLYYSNLSLGPSNVSALAKASGIKRTSVYHVLQGLLEQNIIRKEFHGIKELYVACEPALLLNLLKEKAQKFTHILPELERLSSADYSESVIKYYTGKDACQPVYLDLIGSIMPGDDYLVFGCPVRMTHLYPKFFPEFLKARRKLSINVRMIIEYSSDAKILYGKKYNENNKILPQGVSFRTNVVILKDRVFIQQLSNPIVGMLYFNKDMIKYQRDVFELIWASI